MTLLRPRSLVLAAAVLAGACAQRRPPTPRAPAIATVPNTAAALRARAPQLDAIAVQDASGAPLGRCSDEVVAQVREAFASAEVLEGLAMGPPPWDVRLQLHTRDGARFVAHLASDATVRLCPGDRAGAAPDRAHAGTDDGSASHPRAGDPAPPDCSDPAAAARGHELAIPPALFDELGRIVGRPPRREYQLAPRSPGGATNSPLGPEVR